MLTIDDLTEQEWERVAKAFARGQLAEISLSKGQPVPVSLESGLRSVDTLYEMPFDQSEIRAELKSLRDRIGKCSETVLVVIDAHHHLNNGGAVDFVANGALLSAIDSALSLLEPVTRGGKPASYARLEAAYVLRELWASRGLPTVLGKRQNQSAKTDNRYAFNAFVKFCADGLLKLDDRLITSVPDRPTIEPDPPDRRTSHENACVFAWHALKALS